MKKVTFAILAHVDAGKTTLSEAMLFHAGVIKKMGRVDKEDSFLDYDIQERKRGITIFSKEISFMYRESQMTFLDTPGHNDSNKSPVPVYHNLSAQGPASPCN
jgi:ribosomal protection tetracycline resistance protein